MKLLFIGLGALMILFSTVNPAYAQWFFQIVDAAGDMGYYSQIVITSDGTPYIFYIGGYGAWLTWQVNPSGSWNRRSVGSDRKTSLGIVCDSSDNLHLAWSSSYREVYYAIFSSATKNWILEPERVASEYGHLAMSIFEEMGTVTPTITYLMENGVLRVAERNPSTNIWSFETIYTTVLGYDYFPPSIAADAAGHCHISFYDHFGKNLMYATNAPDNIWGSQVVDVAGDVGSYSSIVIDADGYPCIAYYDATNGDLKYAKMVAH